MGRPSLLACLCAAHCLAGPSYPPSGAPHAGPVPNSAHPAHAAQVCYENLYITGVSGSVLSKGESGLLITERLPNDGGPTELAFAQSNTSATTHPL